jgi:hypothetical protein
MPAGRLVFGLTIVSGKPREIFAQAGTRGRSAVRARDLNCGN